MGFSVSPSITVREFDASMVVPVVSTVIIGAAGHFHWGPVGEKKQVTSENDLRAYFGTPTATNYETWFNCAEFLRYGSNLWISRAIDSTTAKNAGIGVTYDAYGVNTDPISTNPYIPNSSSIPVITFGTNEKLQLVAAYPGTLGNTKIKVAVANVADFPTAEIENGVTFIKNFEYAPVAGTSTDKDQIAVAVLVQNDMDTNWTIVEKWVVSLDSTAKDYMGKSNYIENVINTQSQWIYAFNNTTIVNTTNSFEAVLLAGGVEGAPDTGDLQTAYDQFENPEEFDISILIDAGNTDATTQGYIVDICDERKDCMAILCVPKDQLLNVDLATAVTNSVTWATTTLNKASSYVALYSQAKWMYDKYNDDWRWISMSGDVAGVYVVTETGLQAWYPPAGDYCPVRNVTKLAINPKKSHRDTMYAAAVNPIVGLPGQGILVYGQKTLQSYPSAFDRVNVRRLFIILEKSIATAAKHTLFKINDTYTQNLWKLSVEPFLKRVMAGRGIYAYTVICDSTNNTPAVIDTNGFVGDVYVQPARGIEYIQLNFTAVGTGVDFNEIIRSGQ